MTFVHRTWRIGLAAALVLLALAAVAPALAANVAVSIADKTFEPAELTVAPGDTVTWTVTKSIGEAHTVTSAAQDGKAAGAIFDSQKDDPGLTKLKDEGATFSFTFLEPGEYPYACVVHAGMTGTIVVQAAGGEAPGEAHAGIPTERKLLGAGILVATLAVLFGAAWFWRRMNPA
jgi:plastocyanin